MHLYCNYKQVFVISVRRNQFAEGRRVRLENVVQGGIQPSLTAAQYAGVVGCARVSRQAHANRVRRLVDYFT